MNKFFKALIPALLVLALLVASMPAFAASSPTLIAVGEVKIGSKVYNGEKQLPSVIRVYDANGKKISSKYYTVKISAASPVDAGKYKVTIIATKYPYTGKVTGTFRISKAANPFTIKASKTTFTYNKKKTQTAAIEVTGVEEDAKLSRWTSSNPNVYVRNGKVVVKKGFKGKAYIYITAKKTDGNYKKTTKRIKIIVK